MPYKSTIDVEAYSTDPLRLKYLIMDLNPDDGIEVYKAKLNGKYLRSDSFLSAKVQSVNGLKFLVLEIAANLDLSLGK